MFIACLFWQVMREPAQGSVHNRIEASNWARDQCDPRASGSETEIEGPSVGRGPLKASNHNFAGLRDS